MRLVRVENIKRLIVAYLGECKKTQTSNFQKKWVFEFLK